MLKKGFEFLEHRADAFIAAYGETLKEAFESAASAMFETMTDLETIESKIEECIEVNGEDEYALLYLWLESLLVKFDTSGNLYTEFKVEEIRKDSLGYVLKARVWGEQFDPEKHLSKAEVKAITYHRMEIIKEKRRVTVKFVLDL